MEMIKGMTGFGSSQLSLNAIKMVVEVKSVNHRYLDIIYYLPNGFGSFEHKIRQVCQRYLQRGRLTVTVKIIQKFKHNIKLNEEIVRKYLENMRFLQKEFKLKGEMSLSDIAKFPGVFDVNETCIDSDSLWDLLEKSLKKSLISLVNMRKQEGKSLSLDINNNLKKMIIEINKIQIRIKEILNEKQKFLSIDELQSFRKGADINEEISRLKHYILEQKKNLRGKGAIGKEVDFIAQEMQRETNTIGSKVQDSIVSSVVITLKSKIEKIREQAQNIE